jgi:DNA repair protein SbcC/Rad50
MKPIKLTISAFGPYADVQTIDFRELGNRRFFLIHGPTGGGKTTILDAMCYALYGDTSGKERDGEQMRSQLAKADVPTAVTFDFAVGDKQFRVTRKPRQERPKKKGEGTKTDNPIAELWDRTGVEEDAEGTPLATQPTKVTEQVVSLLGFRSEQFRQVIMLPQDKFRELLLADSAQREDILQTLFRTGFYEQVQEALKAKAKVVAQESATIKDRYAFVLGQAEVATLDELKARQVETQQADVTASANLKLLRDAEAVAQSKHTADQQTNARFVEYRSSDAALKAIELKQTEVDKTKAQIDAAERALKVAVEESALRLRKKENDARKAAQNDAAKNEKNALLTLEAAKAKVTAEEAKKDERERHVAAAARLNGLKDRVANLETATSNAAEAKAHAAQLAEQLGAAKRAHATCKTAAETAKAALAAAQSLAAPLEGHRLAATNTQKAVSERIRLAATDAAIAAKTKQLAAAQQKVSQAQLALQAAKASSADVQRAWIDGQSARLAKKLVDGEPCPVCGAKDHPLPASSNVEVPSDDALKDAHAAVDNQVSVVEGEHTVVGKLEGEIAGESATANTIRQSLGDAASEDVASLQQRLNEQKAALQRSNQASESIKSHEQEVSEAANAETAAKQFEEGLAEKHQLAVVAASTTEATLVECRNGVPEKLTTVALLDAEVIRFRGLADGIDAAIKRATDAFNTAQQAATAAGELSKSAQAECITSETTFQNAKEEFARKRAECGFASDPELTAAKQTDTQLSGLRELIESHTKLLSAANDRAARASEAVAGLQVPDLEASKTLAETSKTQLHDGITLSGNLKRDLDVMGKALADLDEASKELNSVEAQYAVIGRIAEVADGKNNAGLKFSRFVLGFLLDDVLIAATERLKIMSKGRYQLQRRKERADLRSHGGLDLEVFDAHTGFSRAAATLSGGESFLASLSLALGLADVVQAQAGGIRMETMFIDEGFASLDSETLDLAIRSLIDLFKDGRLVGIISHVTELQERIDARLEIMTTLRGSAAKFVLS